MGRQHAWFGANVRPGSRPIPSGSAGSCSLTKQVSIPKWRACGGAVPSGQRMVAAIPHGHWKTMTFIAGLRGDGLTAPWVP